MLRAMDEPNPMPTRSDPARRVEPASLLLAWRRPAAPVAIEACGACGAAVGDRFGWCAGCRLALCFACGRRHFCRPSCPESGCIAGLCVREVRGGVLSERWGLPAE